MIVKPEYSTVCCIYVFHKFIARASQKRGAHSPAHSLALAATTPQFPGCPKIICIPCRRIRGRLSAPNSNMNSNRISRCRCNWNNAACLWSSAVSKVTYSCSLLPFDWGFLGGRNNHSRVWGVVLHFYLCAKKKPHSRLAFDALHYQ